MGEVFRARDTRLNRDVAIKILPPLFADDPERLVRFEREAQVLASLNHPNIAHIYGIEESSGRKALVMELVDGDDLAVRIARDGAMPLVESLAIARQLADALACAHEQNVIHRDLKPANVKVREDGTVKVLDFGLAKLADPSSTASSSPLLSPTITSPATQLGVILGTAAYMAPEQARGKAVDKRADVWAFALVLYEMLTGKRAFEGSEISDTLAFVLTKDPDWSVLPADTPAGIRRLLRRCLQKERKQRLADMSDARLELDEALAPVEVERPAIAPVVAPPRSRKRGAAIAAAILAAAGLGAAAAWALLSRPTPSPALVRFNIPLPQGVVFTNPGRHVLAISPDGTRIVFVANQQLYLRSIGDTTPQPIAGSGSTGAVISPVFSPDGQHLAYYSAGAIRRIGVTGGTPVSLATTGRNPFGLNWSASGIFVAHGTDGIVCVPADGGQPETVIAASKDAVFQGPQLLPGGEWLLFTAAARIQSRWDTAHIVVQSLKSGERRVLFEGGGDARYLATGHIVYAVAGVLFGVPFDLERMKVTGSARPVVEGVQRSQVTGASQFAVAENGTLAYVPGPVDPVTDSRRLAFLDRSGTATPLKLPLRPYESPRVSPDGTRLAISVVNDEAADIWIYELSGASAIRRLTFGGRNVAPSWSADGRQIAFQSDRDGDRGLYLQSADVSGAATRLTTAPADKWHLPGTWSPDGQLLAFSENGGGEGSSVHILSMKDKIVRRFHADPKLPSGGAPAFSPSGRWLAYHSSRTTERPNIVVEPFPATGARYEIAEGLHPQWSPDGTELFTYPLVAGYFAFRIVTEPRFTFSPLGPIGGDGVINTNPNGRNYDVMPDGKRLVVVMRGTDDERPAKDIEVVLNWTRELRNP